MQDVFFKLHRSLLLYTMVYGAGCLLYFHLPTPPDLILWVSICGVWGVYCICTMILKYRYSGIISPLSLVLHASLLCGLLAMAWTTFMMQSHHVTTLSKPLKHSHFQADIIDMAPTPSGWRYYVIPTQIEKMRADHLPTRIRFSTKNRQNNFQIGMRIQGKIVLYPPHLPITPYGFQSHQWAYFNKIGALGWAYDLKAVTQYESDFFSDLRQKLTQKLYKSGFEQVEKSILLALFLGQKSLITEKTADIFQQVGLSHLLAISGLHMGLIIGFSALIARYLFQLCPISITRYDTKLPAIIIAIMMGWVYLSISGGAPSAMRAFIMCALVALAIASGRQVFSIRTICLAALILLIYRPNLILNAGFQLSFAAVLGLVASVEILQYLTEGRIILIRFLKLSLLTSCIASLATLPFILLHFQTFTLQSLISNIVAVPLTGFIILPAGFIGFIFASLEVIFSVSFISQHFFQIAAFGCAFLSGWAEWVNSLTIGFWQIAELLPISQIILIITFLTSIVLLTNGSKRKQPIFARLLMVIAIWIIAVASTVWIQKEGYEGIRVWVAPNGQKLMISHGGKAYILNNKDRKKTKKSSKKSDFIASRWQVALGQTSIKSISLQELEALDFKEYQWRCELESCTLSFKMRKSEADLLTIVTRKSALSANCDQSVTVLIALFSIYTPCPSPTFLVDSQETYRKGAHWIQIRKGDISFSTAFEKGHMRAWGRQDP